MDSLEKNNDQSQYQVQQLLKERDKLIEENKELNMGLNKVNEKVKESIIIFTNKSQQFNKIVQSYKNKLKEYKNKIILLKRRIDELLGQRKDSNNFLFRKDKSDIIKQKTSNIRHFSPNRGSFSQGKLNFDYSSNYYI